MRFFIYRIKYFFSFDLSFFLLDHGFHVLSAAFALVGLVATLENVTWLMIVGTIVAFLARLCGYIMETVGEELFDEIPIFLKSTLVLLIVTVIGMFLLHFLLHTDYGTSFLLSFNGSILLFYALIVIFIMMSHLRFATHRMNIRREIRREKRKTKKQTLYDDEDEEI